MNRKRFDLALLIGIAFETALLFSDHGSWHPPMWTQTPGLLLGFALAARLTFSSFALDFAINRLSLNNLE